MTKKRNLQARIVAPRAPKVADSTTTAPELTFDGLQNVVAGLGTDRDKASYSTYAKPKLLDRITLENMFRGSWLARKVVSIVAEDMCREWRSFQFDDEEVQEVSQFELETAERKLGIRQKVSEAITWARLYGGGVLLLGVGGPNDYEKPLDPAKVRKGDLKFVRALDRWTCIAEGTLDWDLSSPNFGKPLFYRIGTQKGPRVHHSRIIRFEGAILPYLPSLEQTGWGDSILQSGYDTLLGRDTVTAGIATMLFEANVDVLTVEGLNDLVSTKDGENKVIKRFQLAALMKSFNRLLLIGEGESYDKKHNQFSGLDSIMREFRAEVSGAFDIPVTRLFGTSVGGMNATGDNEVRNYYDNVSAQQENKLRPPMERFDEVFVRSTLGTMPDDFRFIFNPLWQLSAAEKATTEKTRADRDKVYLDAGIVNEGVVARQLKEDGTYSVMTEEDVEAAEEIAAALTAEPEPEAPPVVADPDDPAATDPEGGGEPKPEPERT